MFLTLIIAFVLTVLLYLILPELYKYYSIDKAIKSIPGPPNLIFETKLLSEDFLKWLMEQHVKYNGIFKTKFFQDQRVNISRPEHLERILSNNTNIDKSYIYNFLHHWLGNGLLTSTGRKWFRDRKLITPAFHFNILSKFAGTISAKAVIFCRSIENELMKNPEKPIDIFPLAINFTLDALCETAMGVDVHAQGINDIQYPKDVQRVSDQLYYRFFRPWLKPDWIFALTTKGKEYFISLKRLHEFMRKVIQEKQKTRRLQEEAVHDDTNGNIVKEKKKVALLDLLLTANEEDANPLTDEELREHVDTFLFAGHDTTAASISWALFCLGNEPEAQEKLHEELDDVFGDSNEPATMQEINQLKYLDRVIKESLRLYPAVPKISRCITKEIQIDEFKIPKNCTVSVSIINTHRNPDVWPNPDKFEPDRFLPENARNRHPYAYVPFSAGPRNCIGQKYAMLEDKIALTAILRKWKVKSLKNHKDIQYYATLILKPLNGVYIYFVPRK